MKYIKCSNVVKQYNDNIVLNNFNFTFTNSYINFLQGANGTGKTTLILCILDFLKYKGVIRHNMKKLLFQPEKVVLPDYITVKTYLNIILKYHKQNCLYAEELIKKFNMNDKLEKDIITLSKGMKQKVLLIQTLMVESDCYIFDEPLSGLDPLSQEKFIDEIKKLFNNKKLVIIITHFPEHYNLENKLIIDFNQKDCYGNFTS